MPFLLSLILSFSLFEFTSKGKETLSTYEGEEITLRGFLYQSEQGEMVLAPEPNLRSCCIGQGKKLASQVILKGFPTQEVSSLPVEIKGLFHIKEGRYCLDQGELLKSSRTPFELWPAFLALFLSGGAFFGWKMRWRSGRE